MVEWVVLNLMVLLTLSIVFLMLSKPRYPITEMELDEIACEQMRKSGCSECQIEKFMGDHRGYYCPPVREKEHD